jgi:hypothetical protein
LLARQEESRLHGAFRHIEQRTDFVHVVTLDACEDDNQSKLLGQRLDRLPQFVGALASRDNVGRRPWLLAALVEARLSIRRYFTRKTSTVCPLSIERHPPRHAHQPDPEPGPISQLLEASIRFGEGFLCDVFRIFPLPEDAERHTERQPRGVRQASLELTLELPVGRHEAARKAFGVLMHQASPSKTPHQRRRFTS